MDKSEIKKAVTSPNKELRMPRHKAVAELRAHGGTAKERRREVQEWIYEVNPPRTLDTVKKDFLSRRISRRTALVQLGKLESKPKGETLFNIIKGWKEERRAELAANRTPKGTENNKGKRHSGVA
jgi:hypothetical protein